MTNKATSAISYFVGVMAFVVAATVSVAVLHPAVASAAGTKSSSNTEKSTKDDKSNKSDASDTSKKQDDTSAKPSSVMYIYVAQPGDSYSAMARKAVQTYGKKFKIHLSLAGIIFAETNLTQEAGSPWLMAGQTVSISEAAVKNWADKALNLTPAEAAAWQVYVPYVDFNTDHVGQP